MRIGKITPALLIITLLCCSLKCRKDKDKPPVTLPPITQEGKNTFGCKVDGEIWVPYEKCGFGSNPCGELFSSLYSLSSNLLPVEVHIGAGLKENDNALSYFSIESDLNSGISTLGNKIDSIKVKYVKPGSIEYGGIRGVSPNTNLIITKLDTIQKIISGTFEGVFYNSSLDSVKITDGRFDLKFQTCRCSN